ncbi:Adaptor protein complex beta subunit [Coccomyxa subellipsoidea C-169]|uniref:Beta-adaptin-like protein n=1 Tax=Coccomyxa subellipsoidea (strain C-169) TaxID=574566 RepID=I0Z324_COCSC|nr:Adaptor protein complex beta subunit [Coccomyxa subellipsoidea C-169]EIE25043.1 Adaptor protein complex beta subunit [Coccomyxa subellipsoidea C-169]|eukprot:XP_005649587.1 Adaptor protein complex beta subunit [Coccomyxa subellipsoidea C-169]
MSGDGKYFSTTKKGEIHELKEELRVLDKSRRKDAVKKVIAAMTVGKDVSPIFPDVVNCMQTDDLELKKLVYLYLINYAKSQPDLAIMAVNTFVKDSQDPNPLIRALAVRTMGCIRVDKITEYLCDPLQRCLKDDDPYVRKTAAVCVAKLYDINPELVEDRGFLELLKDLLADSNPMVVANAVAALADIRETSTQDLLVLTNQSLFKLLRALNECTEWGQVYILDAIAKMQIKEAKDAESIVERVVPRLQHANSAVVLSAVKVVLLQLPLIADETAVKTLVKKLGPPLVTLLSEEAEVQYVALRNINLIVQKHPEVLSHEIKASQLDPLETFVFFCKYNDPIYVKLEKLDIMIALANERNIDQVLLELKEYATEVDVDFVRKAVRAIGRCAVTLERAAERCINVLLELIKQKVNYVVQEAVVVIKDIFRRYPNRYESIIATLCDSLDSLDEPEARASMVWIIGEYAERIDNADELLESFLEAFPEENAAVQLQLVTAAVKLFLKNPQPRAQQMIQLVLTYATQETDNPDLRDRAYVYWRLLSSDPEAARAVVLAEKPVISQGTATMDPQLLATLLGNLSTLSSVYHLPPSSFVTRAAHTPAPSLDNGALQRQRTATDDGHAEAGSSAAVSDGAPSPAAASASQQTSSLIGDLLDLDISEPTPAAAPPPPPVEELVEVVNAQSGKGLAIKAGFSRENNGPVFLLQLANGTQQSLDGFMLQFNKNAHGVAPTSQVVSVPPLGPGETAGASVPLTTNPALINPAANPSVIQVAIRNNQQGVLYFSSNFKPEVLAAPAQSAAPLDDFFGL